MAALAAGPGMGVSSLSNFFRPSTRDIKILPLMGKNQPVAISQDLEMYTDRKRIF